MKLKRNLFFSITLACFLVLLSGCEAEKVFIQESVNGKKMKREITFEEFKREISQPNFSKKVSFINSTSSRSILDFDIDTTMVKVLEKNIITYTMKLNPKFETNQNKFYNLIVHKINSELNNIIIEFTPTSYLLSSSSQDIYQFLNNSTKEIIYYTNQNSSLSNRTEPFCPKTIYEVICTCAGQHRYNDPECTCSTFASNSYVVLSPCLDGGGTGGEDPNDPNDPIGGGNDGGVPTDPVIPTTNEDNCNDLKSKSLNQDFKNKMNELKGDSNGYFETGFQMFANTPKFTDKKWGTLLDPSGINFEVPTRNDCTGFIHCHLNNSTNPDANNFAIFTPDDFTGLTSMLINSTRPINEITMYLTVNVGDNSFTYAIKIKDVNKFIDMCTNMNNEPERYERMWEEDIKTTNTPEKQVNEFLKLMENEKFDEGIELYKCDDNYQNWEQLILNATKNTIKIKC